MAKIFSFINYKGGVGKTTTTYHIGCSLANHHGEKVLLIDIDPQTNLTFLCKEYNEWKKFKENNGTILTWYQKYKKWQGLNVPLCIWQNPIGHDRWTKIEDIDLLPCDLDLLGEDIIVRVSDLSHSVSSDSNISPFGLLKKQAKKAIKPYLFLQKVIKVVRNRYDYILIDCPPNLYMMTQNALIVSDYYIITTIPEYLSLIGLRILIRKVKEMGRVIKKYANLAEKNIRMAKLGGIIFVKVRVGGNMITKQHKENMNDIRRDEKLGKYCFDTYTTELIGYSEAAESRLPIWLAESENAKRAAKKREYEEITKEFIRRFSKWVMLKSFKKS